MYSSCQVTCHHCHHSWVYMGMLLARLGRSRRPVKIKCPRCRANIVMDAREAR